MNTVKEAKKYVSVFIAVTIKKDNDTRVLI